MKKIFFFPILFLFFLVCSSCDSSSSGSNSSEETSVTISADINEQAEEYDNFPGDSEVKNTKISVEDEEVDNEVSTDVGVTEDSEVDVSVTIPEDLSSRASYSDVIVQIWLNGTIITIDHDGTLQTVSTTITLQDGNNLFCFILTKNGVTYRSIVIHIYHLTIDPQLIGKWVRTEDDFSTKNETDGFEFTSAGVLYDLKYQNDQWEQTEILGEHINVHDGILVSYDSDHPFADLYESSYSLDETGTYLTIVEGTTTLYGVKIIE